MTDGPTVWGRLCFFPTERCIFRNDMREDRVHQALKKAIKVFLTRDTYLLENNIHEVSISSKLARYLAEDFEANYYNVDAEYSRNLVDLKRMAPTRKVRPDVIVHRRGTNENLLAIELKVWRLQHKEYTKNKAIRNDLDKLNFYRASVNEGGLGYMFSYLLIFRKKDLSCVVLDKDDTLITMVTV
jgi:hypothetical protein